DVHSGIVHNPWPIGRHECLRNRIGPWLIKSFDGNFADLDGDANARREQPAILLEGVINAAPDSAATEHSQVYLPHRSRTDCTDGRSGTIPFWPFLRASVGKVF